MTDAMSRSVFRGIFAVTIALAGSAALPPAPASADPRGVTERPIEVLHIEGIPVWEYRYLKNLLVRDPSFAFRGVLLSADPDFPQAASPDLQPLTPGDVARIDPDAYDVIILGSLRPGDVARVDLDGIARHVRRGGGLIVRLGEETDDRPFRGTALEELLPVRLAEVGTVHTARGAGFALAAPAAQEEHPAARALAKAAPLPNMYTHVHAWPRQDAATIIRIEGELCPAVVTGRHGRGRTTAVLVDETWRWRAGVGDRVFGAFWRALVDDAAPEDPGRKRRVY